MPLTRMRERLGSQLLPRSSGWKKPSFTIEDLLITGRKYFLQELQHRRSWLLRENISLRFPEWGVQPVIYGVPERTMK